MNKLHVYPVNDLIEHTLDKNCVCGPSEDKVRPKEVLIHHSLDGRERLSSIDSPMIVGYTTMTPTKRKKMSSVRNNKSYTFNLSFLFTAWALMLLLGIIHLHTLSNCAYNTLCNRTSPVPNLPYWTCVAIAWLTQIIVGGLRGRR